jgi:hypothetical protein
MELPSSTSGRPDVRKRHSRLTCMTRAEGEGTWYITTRRPSSQRMRSVERPPAGQKGTLTFSYIQGFLEVLSEEPNFPVYDDAP